MSIPFANMDISHAEKLYDIRIKKLLLVGDRRAETS